jgi:hypothetical protein|tara:strand:- start:4382 stop:5143 length:762 start_codon:yes stop_codon:yes gene_type:complete
MELEIIFAEFGSNRNNNNNLKFGGMGRLDPTYLSVKEQFPNAKLTLYTDCPEIGDDYDDVEVRVVDVENDSPFSKSHSYWGWFCCDYYEVCGLLESKADIAISMDSDLMFASDEVKTLLPITKKFGVCVPTNERQLVKVDGIHTRGNNGDYYLDEDESRGNLLTYDLWWTSFDTTNKRARKYLEELKLQMSEKHPNVRAPLHMSRAAWESGINPYSMPIQWGVGSGHIGCGNEIILHVGHTNVQDHYLERRID